MNNNSMAQLANNAFPTQPLRLHCVGLSHHTSPLALREKLSITAVELPHILVASQEQPEIDELLILSTCNRLELYATATSSHVLRDFLAGHKQVCAQKLDPHLYRREGLDAARHLFKVAAGLDSLVLGEPQILGQVRRSFDTAVSVQTAGHTLTSLLRTAIRVGKRARTETTISCRAASVSSAAVDLMAQRVPNLTAQNIMVVGAGEMAQLALKNLHGRGATHLTIINRTPATAQQLAHSYGANGAALSDLAPLLRQADIVFVATGATQPLITADMVQKGMAHRPQRPLWLVDLSVPRNVDPAVGQLAGVHLFDVDDLRARVDEALQERQQEVPRVEAIIQSELTDFARQLREAAVRPTLRDLRRHAEEIRQQELTRTLRFMPPDLDEDTRQHIEHLSRSLIKKLLHEPTTRLRREASGGEAENHAASLRYLFALD